MRESHGRGIKRHELTVGDVMAPAEDIVALRLEDVRAAKVGHIVASLKQAGRHHELVAETLPGGEIRIRGMFSVSQIARQLGVPLQISELARTFAEIEQALVVVALLNRGSKAPADAIRSDLGVRRGRAPNSPSGRGYR